MRNFSGDSYGKDWALYIHEEVKSRTQIEGGERDLLGYNAV
jgi:hypothetical protein